MLFQKLRKVNVCKGHRIHYDIMKMFVFTDITLNIWYKIWQVQWFYRQIIF